MKKIWGVLIAFLMLLLAFSGIYAYYILIGPDYSEKYENQLQNGSIKNPTQSLEEEEAVETFNESFVFYILFNIKAYNLHSPPFSSEKPRIEFQVDNKTFNAEIDKGEILVYSGRIEKEDIRILTTAEEGVKMTNDKNYISESFSQEKSIIELVAGKTKLASKGYLKIYKELTENDY